MINQFSVTTQDKYQLINITDKVQSFVKQSEIKDGLIVVSSQHTTTAIIITEDEKRLKKDWLSFLQKLVSGNDFLHDEIDDNTDSHILSGLLGQNKTLIIKEKELLLGVWQSVFLLELDGPRERFINLKII